MSAGKTDPSRRPNAPKARGRHFFFNPGPTNIPDAVLAALHHTSMDFMGAEFAAIQNRVHGGIKQLLKTEQNLLLYAANGHGAWEASLVNCFSPGEKLLLLESGYFASDWGRMAGDLGYDIEALPADWRTGVAVADVEARLKADVSGTIKGVLVVHNETATGVVHPVLEMRRALDRTGHKALVVVDAISSFGSLDIPFDAWGIDVLVAGSQKGLMMVTGMSLTGISKKALARSQSVATPRGYFDWRYLMGAEPQRFPGTSPTHLFQGLDAAMRIIEDEGFENTLARHRRFGTAVRAAVAAWSGGARSGVKITAAGFSGKIGAIERMCTDPARVSDSVTTILLPDGHDANAFRALAHQRYNLALGGGLGPLAGRAFRIGHMGDLNVPMLLGALATTELALADARIPHKTGAVEAAIRSLREAA